MSADKRITIVMEKRLDAINLYILAIVKELKKSGKRINIITFDNGAYRNKVVKLYLELLNLIRLIFMVNRDDLILFTDPLSFNLLGSLALPNKKYVIFYHYENEPFFYKYIPFLSFKKLIEGLDGVMCISKFSLTQIRALGINPRKLEVIYGGVDHELFKPSEYKPHPFNFILSIGSEEPRKNMLGILTAFKMLLDDFPDLRLIKVGNVSPKNREVTLGYVKKLGLTEKVFFTDYLDKQELPRIYSEARLLVFPSLLEGFGMPLVEAMACGCPVITSNFDPMQELVGITQPTVDPFNPGEIAKACKEILSNVECRKEAVQNSLERAKFFDWKNTAARTIEFIEA